MGDEMERKLTAILSADVKGYSRLMGEDDEATIRTLTAYREVMTSLIQHHHGRVVDSPGDNLLAEFASAVNAVQGAVAVQKELKAKNSELPSSRWMEYRIGVNLGDVIKGKTMKIEEVSRELVTTFTLSRAALGRLERKELSYGYIVLRWLRLWRDSL